jgi:hypothetical protein
MNYVQKRKDGMSGKLRDGRRGIVKAQKLINEPDDAD